MTRKRLLALGACLAAMLPFTSHAADRAALMAQHKGGTLKLTGAAAAGTIDPQINYELKFWQLYAFTYDGLVTFQKVAGAASNVVVADLAEAIPAAQDGGKTYVFKLRTGVKFSNGQDVTTKDVVASFAAAVQGQQPERRQLVQRHRRRRCLPQDAGHLHAAAGRDRRRCGAYRDHPPDRAGQRVLLQAGDAVRHHPAGRYRGQGSRHLAGADHRAVFLRQLRPEQGADHEAQSVFQGVRARRPAGRLPRRDRLRLRPAGRGRSDRRAEWAIRLDVRRKAAGPPVGTGQQARQSRARASAAGVLLHAAEREPAAVQQPQGTPGRRLRRRPQRDRQAVWRQESRRAAVPAAAGRHARLLALLPVHQEPEARASGPRPIWPRPRLW